MYDTQNVSPLVVVSGLGNDHPTQDSGVPTFQIKFDELQDKELQTLVKSELTALSKPDQSPDFKEHKGAIHFEFQNRIYLYDTQLKPSALSPRNPDCLSPIWSPKWIEKYEKFIPSVLVLCIDEPVGTQKENEVFQHVEEIKRTLLTYGTHIIIVMNCLTDSTHVALDSMRRKSLTVQKCVVHLLPRSPVKQSSLHGNLVRLLQEICSWSDKFFTRKMHYLREKRKSVVSLADFMVWDTRYTLKLAFCAEFKGDCSNAVKLFESVYDSVKLMFVNNAIDIDSKVYLNSREILDLVVKELVEMYLPSKLAFDRFESHMKLVEMIWGVQRVSTSCNASLIWRGFQYARFAELCNALETKMESLSIVPNLYLPSGLLWLDSAFILINATNDTDEITEGTVTDPYQVQTETNDEYLSPQNSFLNAISSLNFKPRAKAWALFRYAMYLEDVKNDDSAALEAYKSCMQVCPPPMWPDIRAVISEKLQDGVELFMLNMSTKFPEDAKVANELLFEVSGCFRKSVTFVGKNLKTQVTLKPLFRGSLRLKGVVIKHSLGETAFKCDNTNMSDSDCDSVLVTDLNSSVTFNNSKAKTLQFQVSPLEIQTIKLNSVVITTESGLSQTIPLKTASTAWLIADTNTNADSNTELGPQNWRHFMPNENMLQAHVKSRPAKLILIDNTKPTLSETVGVGENVPFDFQLESSEEEDIKALVKIKLSHSNNAILEKEVNIPKFAKSENIKGILTAPSTFFEMELSATFNTSTDTIPVSFMAIKELNVVNPFRVNFGLIPFYLPEEWPNLFAKSSELLVTQRRWGLESTLLSMLPNSKLKVTECRLSMANETSKVEIENECIKVNVNAEHNSGFKMDHIFKVLHVVTPPSNTKVKRTFEALANIELTWCRETTPELVNKFKLPPIRINLPSVEPRALATLEHQDKHSQISTVCYHLENPSTAVLNFAVSMVSSTYFAFEGPKICNIRLLPCSRKTLKYRLIPLGDVEVDNRRPIPELKVYDRDYKRVLVVVPGDKHITASQGSLFI